MSDAGRRLPYRLLAHTADVALAVRGATLEELFANAAAGMFDQLADAASAGCSIRRSISVEGGDAEALLVAWLSELLFLFETRREVYRCFTVTFPSPGRLEGRAEGDVCRAVKRPIKAVTYHGLRVQRRGRSYQATIVFDV
jgi:SHS2 domain-containing protein